MTTSLSLEKGHRLSLEKGLEEVTLGLGWVPRQNVSGPAIDPDASAFALRRDGKVRNDEWVIYYNQTTSPDGDSVNPASIEAAGDDRGGGDELAALADVDDSEQIHVRLQQVPLFVERIAFVVTIHHAAQRHHNFGLLRNCYIRVFDTNTGDELGRYDLQEDFDTADAVVFGVLVRTRSRDDDPGSWHFEAVGERLDVSKYDAGLGGFFQMYGVI